MRQPYEVGELRERVTLRRYTETQNEYGTLERVATTIAANLPAHVRPMRGNESDRGQQTEATAGYLVVIRYRTGLLERDVVVWRGVEYGVRFIMDRGPRVQFLELEVERGAPQ